ncbi:hypothetical protein C8R43DRAFT_50394 [Mycena crocata]|nr:hypothetical protein C8R43DRAFT_50394 [Mycena crocata]
MFSSYRIHKAGSYCRTCRSRRLTTSISTPLLVMLVLSCRARWLRCLTPRAACHSQELPLHPPTFPLTLRSIRLSAARKLHIA